MTRAQVYGLITYRVHCLTVEDRPSDFADEAAMNILFMIIFYMTKG